VVLEVRVVVVCIQLIHAKDQGELKLLEAKFRDGLGNR
jgi:hypothetical protein